MRLEKRPPDMKMTLKTARELCGLTQAQAAQALGISAATLGNYEGGKSFPSVPTIKKIEKFYGIKYNQIIFLPFDFG